MDGRTEMRLWPSVRSSVRSSLRWSLTRAKKIAAARWQLLRRSETVEANQQQRWTVDSCSVFSLSYLMHLRPHYNAGDRATPQQLQPRPDVRSVAIRCSPNYSGSVVYAALFDKNTDATALRPISRTCVCYYRAPLGGHVLLWLHTSEFRRVLLLVASNC